MYAVQDVGMAVTSLPSTGFTGPQAGQVEPRAVESTESGSLESEGRDEVIFKPASPVVQLVQDSAQGYAQLVENAEQLGSPPSLAGIYMGDNVGSRVDVYA